jgi:hypothetical protein
MSSSKQIAPIISQEIFGINPQSKTHSYNDLINYVSIRKQFSRLIPQYINYQNKKYISNVKYISNIEEIQKLKQEIISIKESISLLKEKKQKKLEQIEELRCFMRKIGNKQKNYHSKENANLKSVRDYQQRDINNKNNNNNMCNNKIIDKKQVRDNIKGFSDEVEGGLPCIQSTSDLSSGKDDEAAQEKDNYEGVHQCNFTLCVDNCSGWNSSNKEEQMHYCFKEEENNNKELLG